ncbi:RNA helicase required for poly(A+) mRNA export [Podila humilis]|nr:RNA helicase required for poly(A+) mRNA export [Podila humilis]
MDYANEKPQAVILAPTRELTRQIVEVFKELGQFTPVKIYEAIFETVQRTYNTPIPPSHIVVGTPGTVFSLMAHRCINKDAVRMFVLDEADYMLDLQNLGDQSMKVKRVLPSHVQVVLFSATWDRHMLEYAQKIMSGKFNQIHLKLKHLVLKSIKQFYIDCHDESDRFDMLVALYSLVSVSQSMIFVARRETARRIGDRMSAGGHSVAYLHGGMTAEERDLTIDSFRSAQVKVLISTNVLARGIDVANVNLVVNYDLPSTRSGEVDYDAYLHRIGRTGRFGRMGVTVNFVHDQTSYRHLLSIQEHYGQELMKLPCGNPDEAQVDRLDRMEKFIKDALKA